MKSVCFITNSRDLSVGSYRIWVNDLNNWLCKLNIESKIYSPGDDISNSDIIICAKNNVNVALEVKNRFPTKKVGVINLTANQKNLPIDFVIVGSLEEKDSLAHYKNVFLFPLIENLFQGSGVKQHQQKNRLVVGYHGSHTHLAKFEPGLKWAVEQLDREVDLQLRIITSDENFKWKVGYPNISDVKIKKWNINTIKEDLLMLDVGVVPNTTDLSVSAEKNTSRDLGLYDTDYILRYKNKSNAGRSFVFHQLGIPVVADFTPSNLHILGNPHCGFVVNSKEGWLKSLRVLINAEKRQLIADNAKREFDRLYDPLDWASRLYEEILEVSHE